MKLSVIFGQAGLNAGDGVNFETLPDSGTENILRLSKTLWIYRVDTANSQSGCVEDFTGISSSNFILICLFLLDVDTLY